MTIDTTAVQSHVAPYDLVQRMRASIQIMGPLVARFGHARVAMPGGCNLGPRKIDIHLRGLAEMGGEVRSDHGFVEVTADKLHAVDMFLDYPSVGATENLLMAARHGRRHHHPRERGPRARDRRSVQVPGQHGGRHHGRGQLHDPHQRGQARCTRPSTP